jgi:signal transduction histidine kinase
MRRTGLLPRPFLLRRTVRSRMTLLYGALFLLSGAVLLAIAGGVSVGSSREAQAVPAPGRARPGSPAALTQAQQQIAHLQAELARARAPSSSPVHSLLIGSVVALASMGVVSAVLGWLIAGRALRPLRQITATARRISEDNLHERLAFAGPDDELKQLADTIDELLGRLESAFAAQRRFVANASHELRTPLATMRASLDVAMAKPDPGPVHTEVLAARLRAELDRIDELLEGFLILARAQHGALPGGGAVELGAVVSAALAGQAAAAVARDLSVSCHLAPGAWVAGGPALISRMAGNLVGNAIVHNEQAGWVDVTVATVAGGRATLVVENGGRQLDQGQVSELGQPFRRLGAERTGSGTGSGLGLSIVAAIAVAHGGSLDLRARAGGGMRAEVTLLLAPAPVLPEAPRLSSVQA